MTKYIIEVPNEIVEKGFIVKIEYSGNSFGEYQGKEITPKLYEKIDESE